MNKKRALSFFLIIFLALICCSVVSATDTDDISDIGTGTDATIAMQENNNMEDIETVDESQKNKETTTKSIEKNTIKNVKQEDSITNWQQLIDKVEEAKSDESIKTITLDAGTYINTETITWNITRELTIDGNGQTIDGNQIQVFIIDGGCSLVLKNITITNAKADYGGAIYNEGNLTVTHSVLHNNNATQYGGAICNNGNLTLSNSVLHDNHVDGEGGAICNSGNLTLSNSVLHDNHADQLGGAIENIYGTVTVTNNSVLHDNHADNYGGAIDSYHGTVTVSNSTLSNNHADVDGGAIWNEGGSVNCTGSTFDMNTPENYIIYNDNGILKIKLERYDHFISTEGDVSILLDDETTGYTGPLGEYNVTKGHRIRLTVNGTDTTTFKDNTFILYSYDKTVSNYTQLVDAVEAAKESNEDEYYIYLLPGDYNATTTMDWVNARSTRKLIIEGNNITLNGKKEYQFMDITKDYSLTLNNITLTNYTSNTGGAIFNRGNLTLSNSVLHDNHADGDGGAIINRGNLTLSNSVLHDNHADKLGGAIENNMGTLTVTNNSVLYNNHANQYGGAIENIWGTLTVTNNSVLRNNTATISGGAIDNIGGTLTVYNSSMFEYNWAVYGGAICNNGTEGVTYYNVSVSNFTNNNASYGAAIYSIKNTVGNITYNNFTGNTADNNETLDLDGERNVENNAYHSTDISIKTINLTVKDDQEVFQYPDDVELNFSINLTTPDNYDRDILGKIDKTIYINNTENVTTYSNNYTLYNQDIGEYTAYYTTYYGDSNIVNFKVMGNSEITTDRESYDFYDGIDNKITLDITDDGGEKGTIIISVKDGEEYTKLSSYPNMEDGSTISTKIIAEALENIFGELSSSYTINLTYYSNLANPSSTEFTLNVIKLRNTSIVYDILNRTEGNVQINITVMDTVYKSPIPDVRIEITGDITENTTSGVLTNGTLSEGDYTILVKFNETEAYNPSETTIYFNVEIDKDAKIVELNDTINDLTQKLNDAYTQIEFLNNTVKNLTKQLKNATDKIESLNENITELNEQLNSANEEIKNLNDTNKDLNDQLAQANEKVKLLEDAVNNLTNKLDSANTQIGTLNELVDNLTEQLNTANEEIKNLNDTNKDLDDQLTRANDRIKSLEDTVNNLTDKLNDANKQIDSLNDVVDDLTGQLDNANEEIETLENANIDLNDQLTQANDKIKSLNSTVNKLTSQLNDANSQIDTLNNLVDELTEQLNAANNEIEALNNTNKDLNSQLTQANNIIKSLDNEVDKLTEQLDNADKEINELMDIIDELLNKPQINTTITINPIKSSVGSIATLTANIVDVNGNKVSGGKAVFKINGITLKDKTGNVIYAKVSDGLASIQYKVQDVWMKDTSYVESVYSGDDNYASSRTKSTDALQITQGTSKITLDKDTITAMSGETITLRAKVTDSTGDRINTGKVVFKLNGKTLKDENGNTLYAKVTDGEATLDYTIPAIYSAKTYSLTAVFGGGNYERSETTGTLKLERKAVNIKENSITTTNHKTTIKATIIDETGKLLVTSTKLAFKINGKTILNGVNSTNGKINVSFTTTLRPGIYELEIISGENSIYKKGTLTTILTIQ